MDFNNIDDLVKHYSSNIYNQKFSNGKTILQVIKEETELLVKYIKEEIAIYKASYTPSKYIRTGAWEDSIRIEEPKVEGGYIVSYIKFDPSLGNHPSVMKNGEPGFVPWLLEIGWDIEKKVGHHIPNFTKHTGVQYIKKAVERFNKNNKLGITVNVYIDDEQYI